MLCPVEIVSEEMQLYIYDWDCEDRFSSKGGRLLLQVDTMEGEVRSVKIFFEKLPCELMALSYMWGCQKRGM